MSTHRSKGRAQRPAASRVRRTPVLRTGARSRGGVDQARNRLEHLYEISKLLSDFEGLEPTVSAVLAVATQTLPIRSAILIEATEDRLRTVTWQDEGHPGDHLARARAHAQSSYAYLSGTGPTPPFEPSEPSPGGPLPRGVNTGKTPRDRSKFIVIPLVVSRRPLFGVLQLEGASTLQKADLVFVNALTNQLAIALDRHHAWQRDIALRERAEEATRMRDRILAVVSHDLRNPLGVILTTADMLAMAELPEAARKPHLKAVGRIQRAAGRMSRLIADMLDFASIQAGRLAIAGRPTQPASLVNEALASFEGVAQAKGLHLRSEIEAQLPRVYGDSDRILQVLSNLISNAVQITPADGSIVVRAEARPKEVVFTVCDTGPGVDNEELPHLFERHWRSNHTRYSGTGLGLTIAKGIVDAHSGRIWVESKPGQGASLFFTIPVFHGDQAAAEMSGTLILPAGERGGHR